MKDCRRRAIDVVVVWKFDRFARSLKNLIAGLELCRALGIDFVSVTEAVDTSFPAGEMLFQMIGAVAQFEKALIAERVKSGLANARANGKVLGRPPLLKLTRQEIADLRRQREHGKSDVQNPGRGFWGLGVDCSQTMRRTWRLGGRRAFKSGEGQARTTV